MRAILSCGLHEILVLIADRSIVIVDFRGLLSRGSPTWSCQTKAWALHAKVPRGLSVLEISTCTENQPLDFDSTKKTETYCKFHARYQRILPPETVIVLSLLRASLGSWKVLDDVFGIN